LKINNVPINNLNFRHLEEELSSHLGVPIRITLNIESFLADEDAFNFVHDPGARFICDGIIKFCGSRSNIIKLNELKVKSLVIQNQPEGLISIAIDKGELTISSAFNWKNFSDDFDVRECLEKTIK
jgi:hypothetical protein